MLLPVVSKIIFNSNNIRRSSINKDGNLQCNSNREDGNRLRTKTDMQLVVLVQSISQQGVLWVLMLLQAKWVPSINLERVIDSHASSNSI